MGGDKFVAQRARQLRLNCQLNLPKNTTKAASSSSQVNLDRKFLKKSRTHVFGLEFLFAAADAFSLQLLKDLQEVLLVLQAQLLIDDVQVPDGVDLSLYVRDLLVLKST